MSKYKDPEQLPSCQHFESTAAGKGDVQIMVPDDRQSIIRKKFDRRVLPIVCILYVLSYLDRGNIGNAKAVGMDKDLNLTARQWSWVLYSFYICYIIFEWTTIMWKILPAHAYIASLCICWGAAAMCSGAVNTFSQLVACRCLLGIFEAVFGCGAPYFLSLFYQRRELGFRLSLLLGMSPVANCFASALAYGITQINGSLEPWRYLFIIEGAPTILFSIVVFLFLPDSPGSAKFLSETEQTEAVERLQTVDRTAKGKMQWSQVFQGLTDYKNYVHMVIHFCCNYSFSGLSNFLPTILTNMGYTSINAQGLAAPPYLASFFCCVAAALVSDRWGNRGYVVTFFALMGTAGYLILTCVQDESNTATRYAGVWLATCGIFPSLSINITWLLNNQGGDSKKGAGMAMLAIFGQCSSLISSSVFPDADAPLYTKGCALGCAFTGLIAVLAMGLHVSLTLENKKKIVSMGQSTKTTGSM
ncbi:ATP synthase subunit 9 [Penicillium atrosanguineum]|uniref:ATP synthase subunit 9 n=1 Tax=Penicillium atrosanguineum TaxID=1132637 RepID=UPI00239CAFEF|nr:ATP synthase subunit 9 [Penicillium atrosanguineum]KAJ5313448.1 ATP synthase subunit 9 [Penicillium atrosanguineum]